MEVSIYIHFVETSQPPSYSMAQEGENIYYNMNPT